MCWMAWDKLCRQKNLGGLGFKNLYIFNQALLAKQAWRLTKNSKSLLARVLQAKYHRNLGFLEAKLGNAPSYIWRSIIFGRELLQRGVRWRIEDGSRVQVFHDPWLPDCGIFRPITSLCFMHEKITVSELIANGKWREDLVTMLFCQCDREAILNIPLNPLGAEDALIWNYTPKGYFSVSSAYRLGFQEKPSLVAGNSNDFTPWRVIWNCQLPPKVRLFAWKLCHRSLATGENLVWRKIIRSAACMRCNHPKEDEFHLFIH